MLSSHREGNYTYLVVDICKIYPILSIIKERQIKAMITLLPIKLTKFGEVPGGPVVRIQCFLYRSVGSAPGILQARWFSQEKILRPGWAMSGIVEASLQKEDTASQTEEVIRGHMIP